MLSVLIPIYNQDVRKLVVELVKQCQLAGIRYQILCFDDASKEKYKKVNRRLETVYGVSYLEFPKNLGRAKMRNKLGFHGMYENLLFLDCDSKVVTKRFIKNYLAEMDEHQVIYGGTRYQKSEPKSQSKILHWRYGQFREVLTLARRQRSPYMGFRSNNFLIKRDLFLQHPFDEEITGYGHEDTLFALELQNNHIPIHHIDNAVKHGGLEKNTVFLEKVRASIQNLMQLRKREIYIPTRLIELYQKLERWRLLKPVLFFIHKADHLIEKNLMGKNPNMRLLDLWKLRVLDEEWQN